MSNVLVIPDLHLPFQHKKAFKFIQKVIKENDIDEVVFTGDLVDFYAFSKYSKHPDAMSARKEIESAKKAMQQLLKIVPKAKVCVGNHEMRMYKQAALVGFYDDMLVSLPTLLGTGKNYVFADTWEIDGVIYKHGDGMGGRGAAFKLIEKYRRPVVIGHLHGQFSLVYLNNGIDTVWACVAACLVDSESYAMAYGRHNTDLPVSGLTVVSHGVPKFIPLM